MRITTPTSQIRTLQPRTIASAAVLLTTLLCGCAHSLAAPSPPAPPAHFAIARDRILVDRRCHVLDAQIDGIPTVRLQLDHILCQLQSVRTSQHHEEALLPASMQRTLVTVSEQEYLLDNVAPRPIDFVVQQYLPPGWTVDSDPQPEQLFGSYAIFRVHAEPGQVVRLHVGERRSKPIR